MLNDDGHALFLQSENEASEEVNYGTYTTEAHHRLKIVIYNGVSTIFLL
jgi:hypothetical protein